MLNSTQDDKLTPDLIGLEMVDRLCTELSDEAADFLNDNKRLSNTAGDRQALAQYRGFPIEVVDWLVAERKVGITEEGEWSLPFEGYFRTDKGIEHRIFGRQIKTFKNWRCSPADTPLPIVPFMFWDYTKAERLLIVEGAWDAMALVAALGWHLPSRFPLNTCILGVRGVHLLRDLFGFVGKNLGGRAKVVVIAQNDDPGLSWIRQPELSRGLIEKAAGIWLTHVSLRFGKDINDAYKKGAFIDWSLEEFLNSLEPGTYKPRDITYGPLVFRKHLERLDPSIIPNGERLYGVNGAKDDFPLDAFPPLAQELAEEQCRLHNIEIPQSGLIILGAVSTAIGTSIAADNFAPGRLTFGNIFCLITAPPGSGKTTLLDFFNAIRERGKELQEEFRKTVYPQLKERQGEHEKELRDLENPKKGSKVPGRPAADIHRELEEVREALQSAPTLIVGKSTVPCLVRAIMSFDKHVAQVLDDPAPTLWEYWVEG